MTRSTKPPMDQVTRTDGGPRFSQGFLEQGEQQGPVAVPGPGAEPGMAANREVGSVITADDLLPREHGDVDEPLVREVDGAWAGLVETDAERSEA